MPTVGDVLSALARISPPEAAFEWDNPGLQVGDPSSSVTRALVSLDPSLDAIAHARLNGAELLLSHHPLLFSATKRLDVRSGTGKRVAAAIQTGVAVVAAHTDWDLASPGLNDALATKLGLTELQPFGSSRPIEMLRLVTYVPEGQADRLLDALAEAGAGEIGLYRRCAFWNHGEGTFEPMPGAHPTIGAVGFRELVPETRIETVLPASRRDAVLAALRAAHPYEEAAFGFVRFDGDQKATGGRIGTWQARSLGEAVASVREQLNTVCRVWGEERPVRRLAVFGGSGGSEWRAAQAAGADALVTGEVRHDQAWEAAEAGFALIEAGHYATEAPGVEALSAAMAERLPAVQWQAFAPEPGRAGRPQNDR